MTYRWAGMHTITLGALQMIANSQVFKLCPLRRQQQEPTVRAGKAEWRVHVISRRQGDGVDGFSVRQLSLPEHFFQALLGDGADIRDENVAGTGAQAAADFSHRMQRNQCRLQFGNHAQENVGWKEDITVKDCVPIAEANSNLSVQLSLFPRAEVSQQNLGIPHGVKKLGKSHAKRCSVGRSRTCFADHGKTVSTIGLCKGLCIATEYPRYLTSTQQTGSYGIELWIL